MSPISLSNCRTVILEDNNPVTLKLSSEPCKLKLETTLTPTAPRLSRFIWRVVTSPVIKRSAKLSWRFKLKDDVSRNFTTSSVSLGNNNNNGNNGNVATGNGPSISSSHQTASVSERLRYFWEPYSA